MKLVPPFKYLNFVLLLAKEDKISKSTVERREVALSICLRNEYHTKWPGEEWMET